MENKKQTKMPDDKITGRLLVTGDLHGDTAALVMIAKKMLEGDVLFVAGDFGFIFRDIMMRDAF